MVSKMDGDNLDGTCPNCNSCIHSFWAAERGIVVVRCGGCGLLYVNPMPQSEYVDEAVKTGMHKALGLVVKARRIPQKVRKYKSVFQRMFADLWIGGKPICWVDVGCGYGEVLEAIHQLAPAGSQIAGFEPMHAKAESARALGLNVTQSYLYAGSVQADVISIVDIFSHIPDFHSFLKIIVDNLSEKGLLYLETGNLADLQTREEFSGELGLPDHLVFCGEVHIRDYLDRAGFVIEKIERVRVDGIIEVAKNIIKRILGRPASIALPYSSSYRSLLIRARRR